MIKISWIRSITTKWYQRRKGRKSNAGENSRKTAPFSSYILAPLYGKIHPLPSTATRSFLSILFWRNPNTALFCKDRKMTYFRHQQDHIWQTAISLVWTPDNYFHWNSKFWQVYMGKFIKKVKSLKLRFAKRDSWNLSI